jgi:trehalose 6-phosphate synthase/phosphatase
MVITKDIVNKVRYFDKQKEYDLIILFVCTVLWPVFHYLVQTSSGDSRAEKRHWDDYVAVNRQFADTVIDRYQKNDISRFICFVV